MLPNDFDKKIRNSVAAIEAVAERMPGVIIIHRIPDMAIEYMSPLGLKLINLSLDEIREISAKEYYERYFNPQDADDYVPKMLSFLNENSDRSISFFQQVKFYGATDWVWHLSTTKILLRDRAGHPLLCITTAYPIDSFQLLDKKVERVLKENDFLRKHYHLFSKLTRRECDILTLLALGKSSPDIAENLFISVGTVETHRKNIRQKLNATSTFELTEYARAFDLI